MPVVAPGHIIHRRVFVVSAERCDFAVFSELAACITVLTQLLAGTRDRYLLRYFGPDLRLRYF